MYTFEIEEKSPVEARVHVTVPKEIVSYFFLFTLKRYPATHPIKGFRPGHVPHDYVMRFHGHEVMQEFVDLILSEIVKNFVDTKGLAVCKVTIVTIEQLIKLKHDADTQITLDLEYWPSLPHVEYKGAPISVEKQKLTMAMYTKALEGFRITVELADATDQDAVAFFENEEGVVWCPRESSDATSFRKLTSFSGAVMAYDSPMLGIIREAYSQSIDNANHVRLQNAVGDWLVEKNAVLVPPAVIKEYEQSPHRERDIYSSKLLHILAAIGKQEGINVSEDKWASVVVDHVIGLAKAASA